MLLVAARTWRPLHPGAGAGGVGHGRCCVSLSSSVIPAKPKIKSTEEGESARLKETISAKGVTLFQGNVNLLCDGTYAAKTSPP